MIRFRCVSKLMSDSIFFILGAGASVDSGLFTYRGPKGIYTRGDVTPEKLLTGKMFNENPDKVWDFLIPQYEIIRNAVPGPTYQKISNICDKYPKSFVLTQNVDRLITQGTNVPIVEVHGRYDQIYCETCEIIYPYYRDCDLKCRKCQNVCRPNIVFFRDHLSYKNITQISTLINHNRPKHVLVIGTSLQFPYLVRLIHRCKHFGAKVTHINPDPTYIQCVGKNEKWIRNNSYDGLNEFQEVLN